MNNVAIITARGGSKRIPRKNIKDFLGKPVLAYSIEAALQSGLFDVVMVSTDDAEIAKVAESYGAQIPFLRSAENADDFAGTDAVVREVLLEFQKLGKKFSSACCLYPTAPFITVEKLKEGYALLKKNNFKCVYPVCNFSSPVQRALQLNGNTIEMMWPENESRRSQDLPQAYFDAGQFYWYDVASFLNEENSSAENTGALILTEMEVQDIDNEMDWKLAELKYSFLHSSHSAK